MPDEHDAATRWRLILGRFAETELGATLDGRAAQMDAALDYLYGREYQGRGAREGGGTLDPSQLTLPDWLAQVRDLFPRETVKVVERHALERYQMSELV